MSDSAFNGTVTVRWGRGSLRGMNTKYSWPLAALGENKVFHPSLRPEDPLPLSSRWKSQDKKGIRQLQMLPAEPPSRHDRGGCFALRWPSKITVNAFTKPHTVLLNAGRWRRVRRGLRGCWSRGGTEVVVVRPSNEKLRPNMYDNLHLRTRE